jgi:hypothetical protein
MQSLQRRLHRVESGRGPQGLLSMLSGLAALQACTTAGPIVRHRSEAQNLNVSSHTSKYYQEANNSRQEIRLSYRRRSFPKRRPQVYTQAWEVEVLWRGYRACTWRILGLALDTSAD